MSAPVATGLTYDDLLAFPDDHLRRELIAGELYVTPPPGTAHQHAVMVIAARLFAYAEQHGGRVLPAPTGVYFAHDTHVEPDVLFVSADHIERVEPRFVRSAPDLVVEVSSPSTRRLDLIKKRALYEREGVPENWFVDLDAEQVDVHVLREDRYGAPRSVGRGEVVTTEQAPGLEIAVDGVLGG